MLVLTRLIRESKIDRGDATGMLILSSIATSVIGSILYYNFGLATEELLGKLAVPPTGNEWDKALAWFKAEYYNTGKILALATVVILGMRIAGAYAFKAIRKAE